jgi:membrane fusion protein (multidrug efflux system)
MNSFQKARPSAASLSHGEKPGQGSRASLIPLAFFVAAVLAGCGGVKASAPPAKPPEVEVISVSEKNVPITSEWTTTLEGYVNAQIQPRVSGYLIRQNYKEGTRVRQGQVLFEIDARPFVAALNGAKGQLAQAEAQLGKAEQDVRRDIPLAEAKAIAQSQLDNDIQAQLAAKAAVQSAKAAVEQALLNLEFTKVTSLVDGIAGIAQTQIGNLVSPTTVLTTVSKVDPIKAYFNVSEQQYMLPKLKANASQDPWKGISLKLMLADGSTYSHPGSFLLADRQVDPSTGTIRVVGVFPNPGNILRPGQFGRVLAETGTKKSSLLVPQRAVTELQGAYQLAVVGDDNKVSIRPVKIGAGIGSQRVIEEGIRPGERVVVEGLQKVRDGTVVVPKAAANQ